MEKELLTFLKKGESVLEALARLGEKVKKQKGKEKEEKRYVLLIHLSVSILNRLNAAYESPVLKTTLQWTSTAPSRIPRTPQVQTTLITKSPKSPRSSGSQL